MTMILSIFSTFHWIMISLWWNASLPTARKGKFEIVISAANAQVFVSRLVYLQYLTKLEISPDHITYKEIRKSKRFSPGIEFLILKGINSATSQKYLRQPMWLLFQADVQSLNRLYEIDFRKVKLFTSLISPPGLRRQKRSELWKLSTVRQTNKSSLRSWIIH